MASIQKRGVKWVAEIRTKGEYASKSFLSKTEAKEWAESQERRMKRTGGLVKGKTLEMAMQRYAKEISPKKKGARWEVVRLTKLCRDDIANIVLTDLRPSDFEEWINRQKLSPSSVNRELTLLSTVFAECKRWQWLDDSPLRGVRRPKDPPHRERVVSDKELERILTALGYTGVVHTQRQHIAVIALFAIETAMRQGEIFSITWDNVHFNERYVYLPETKNGEPRKVPLSEKAVELLQSVPCVEKKVFPFSQQSCVVMYKRAMQLAGVKDATFHDLRHTAITRLASKLDMLSLAKMVGHRDPRNLMIYYNPKPKDIADKLN